MKKFLTAIVALCLTLFAFSGCDMFNQIMSGIDNLVNHEQADKEIKAMYEAVNAKTEEGGFWKEITSISDGVITFSDDIGTLDLKTYSAEPNACELIPQVNFIFYITQYGHVYVISSDGWEYVDSLADNILKGGDLDVEAIKKDIEAKLIPVVADKAMGSVYAQVKDEIGDYSEEWDNINAIENNTVTLESGETIDLNEYIPDEYDVNIVWDETDNSALIEFEGVTYRLTSDGYEKVDSISSNS